jgi:hypothetical protein
MSIPIPDYLERKAAGIAHIIEYAPDAKKALAQSAIYIDEWANERTWIDQGLVSVADMNNLISAAQAEKTRVLEENTARLDAVNKKIEDLVAMKTDVLAITNPPPPPETMTASKKKTRRKTNAEPKFKPKKTAKRRSK